MKKILFLFLLCGLYSCDSKTTYDPKFYYVNRDFKIVEKGIDDSGKYFIIQDTEDTLLYAILTKGNAKGVQIDELYHIKNVGDMAHFEFIAKKRFYRKEAIIE